MSKTLFDLKDQLNEVQGQGKYAYGSDSKQIVTTDAEGRPTYRTVRARRIKVGDSAPSSIGISAPDVGDSDAQDKDRSIDLYTKYYKKYIKALKQEDVEINLDEQHSSEPPFVLVLKRVNIRQFPQFKVAIYHNDKLDKYFSVPYGPNLNAVVQAENTILESEQDTISKILNVFKNLSEEHQEKMMEMINGDFESYLKLKSFALKQHINEAD